MPSPHERRRVPARPTAPVLQSIAPLDAVPGRLRIAVARRLEEWGYTWADVSFAGTVEVPAGEHWPLAPGAAEVWVFAIAAARLAVGDELESAGGRTAGVGVSAFSGGVIPVTPYQAWVYEFLGRHGGGEAPERPAPQMVPTTAPPTLPTTAPLMLPTTSDMERAAPDQRR